MVNDTSSFFVDVRDIAVEAVKAAPVASSYNKPNDRPDWLKVRVRYDESFLKMRKMLAERSLHTVCEEARCPNISECWQKGHATVMILGDTCTRACAFCNVHTGIPSKVNEKEPENVGNLVKTLKLNHVVITSVDRDDLPDGGASQFALCIRSVREVAPKTTVEVLTPDFLRKKDSYKLVVAENPDVFNHNIETVPRLYPRMKQGARYFNSLNLLFSVKKYAPHIFTKSGIIVGLGESDEEIFQTMDDLRAAEVDFLTIGQYLQPTKQHVGVDRYVTIEQFELYKKVALAKGFLLVSSTPLTRSSYHAGEDFQKLQQIRNESRAAA